MGRIKRTVASLGCVLALVLGLSVTTGEPAQAAPVEGFQPGNIITDGLFYDGRAMEPSEVQSFLNERVPRCTIGDPGRLPGAVYGNNRVAAQCLRNFSMATQSKPANPYCAAYAGTASESAAQIITKVGQACGISQKVLLVMLEKEQSLISDSWPFQRQLDVAMGYDCPDSGPNYGANCNPAQIGFFNQVYKAAWQLKVYKAQPNSYNYRPYQNNNILWHPNPGCGTSQVYIENSATAALYIYTPYRPNQAALDAGWGTGDACSTYGNRNFYNFYKGWFGDPRGIPVTGKIATLWNSYGGASGIFGPPSQPAKYVANNGGGYVQEFAGGVILLENLGGNATAMSTGAFLTNYRAAGFVSGSWGWPVGMAKCGLPSGGCTMAFQKGTVAFSAATGSYLVPSVLTNEWTRIGGAASALGYPIAAAEIGTSAVLQRYTGGLLVWGPDSGAREFDSRFLDAWRSYGGVNSSLGAPVGSSAVVAGNGGGLTYEMSRGTIYQSPLGSFAMEFGAFRSGYLAAGGPAGSWGWPAQKAACGLTGGGCYMGFQHGIGMWSTGTGMVLVNQPSFDMWNQVKGSIGYPTKPPVLLSENGGGEVQEFTRGTVWTSPLGSFAMEFGAFRSGYLAAGGPAGSWGWPAQKAACGLTGGGCYMGFQHGIGMWSTGTGMVLVNQPSFDMWNQVKGSIGYPTKPPVLLSENGGGEVQEFTRGTVWTSPLGSFAMEFGAFRSGYLAVGGPAGSWGWPAQKAVCTAVACEMKFQRGTASYLDGKMSFR
ncbi:MULTISPECIES: LGFP repeat-containing protein [unclassified Leucobacter]|uniref:LGFP repeat-containing protein n=1 Tax=unclassified Leucobacter TaxID=2621730 RepID=UPI00165D69D3|nr:MULTISPECIES: hypothetical protein [unclassified Leucobacter]MBC9936600.1 hypothetical protein [Leucobacter sp. cx-87]